MKKIIAMISGFAFVLALGGAPLSALADTQCDVYEYYAMGFSYATFRCWTDQYPSYPVSELWESWHGDSVDAMIQYCEGKGLGYASLSSMNLYVGWGDQWTEGMVICSNSGGGGGGIEI